MAIFAWAEELFPLKEAPLLVFYAAGGAVSEKEGLCINF